MTTIRQFRCIDLLRFASVNLDHFVYTETLSFYMGYLAVWASEIKVAVAPCNRLIGYREGFTATRDAKEGAHWRAHVAAMAVASEYRRQKLATELLQAFEQNHDHSHKAYCTNLFVRVSNNIAVRMFKKLGYTNLKHKSGLYADNEDAFEMRKFYCAVSEVDENGDMWLGLYKANDDLNYHANPLFICGSGRTTKGIYHRSFFMIHNKERHRFYGIEF